MSEYDTTLRINQILWDGASIEAAMRIERICWMRPDDDFIGLINIKDLNANPRIDSLKKIKELVTENALQTSSSDQIVISPLLSTDIGDKYFARAKELYDLFTPFFHENQVELFTEGMRYRVIKKNRVTLQVGLNTVLKYLRRYYQKGMTLDAFVPEYAKCGGAGKERRSIKKLGRPVSPENIGGYSDGMPLSKKDKENLKKGWKKFAGVKKETFQGAYEKTLKEFFFHEIRVLPNGKIERVIDPEKPIPSFTQFTYWGTKKLSKKAIRLKKSSEIEIELNHKPIMNSSRVKEGPGTQYQVDGTGGLVYLVAPWDETKIIGKAQIYGVQDNYSQLVVGWSVVIDNASYATLMLALECAFTDKDDLPADLNEELCERLGLPCGSPLMPKGVVCDELLGDGGPELVGEQSSRLVERGLFSWATAKPRAANWKAYIERFFGHLKAKLNQIPGAADRYRKRGVKAPSELACLTPSEFKSLIIQAIIQYNHSYTVKDHPDAISLARAGYDCCTPINLWEWGSRHRSGSGRSYPKTFIRSVLLPRVDASISSKGIKANNLYYISE